MPRKSGIWLLPELFFVDLLVSPELMTSNMDLGSLMNGPIKQKLKIIPQNVTWGGQASDVFLNLKGDFMRPILDTSWIISKNNSFFANFLVDSILNETNLQYIIYQGQLDLICDTAGIFSLKYLGLKSRYIDWPELEKHSLSHSFSIALKQSYDIFPNSGQSKCLTLIPGVSMWLEKLKWPQLNKFESAKREKMVTDSRAVGYWKRFNRAWFFWILKAGHMVLFQSKSSNLDWQKLGKTS